MTISRRTFLKAGSSFLATASGSALAYEPVRYPPEDLVRLDPSFSGFLSQAPIRRLYTNPDMYWAEGPAWSGRGNYLVWSDIPNDRQLRWLNDDGHVSVLRKPCNYSNGNTFDLSGRQISFEHYPPKVRRYEPDGTETVLAESFGGKSLNGPNDGVIHPNGDLWFSDPGYGGLSDYEGRLANTGSPQPHQKEAIYRIDMKSGKLHKVSDESFKPNGVCFSPDYKKLYAADTGASHYGAEAPAVIRVWDVVDESRLANGFIWAGAGWVGAGYDGVHVFNPDGERVGQILLPEICANVCFGGPLRNRLFMTASQSLYSVYTNTTGAHFC